MQVELNGPMQGRALPPPWRGEHMLNKICPDWAGGKPRPIGNQRNLTPCRKKNDVYHTVLQHSFIKFVLNKSTSRDNWGIEQAGLLLFRVLLGVNY